MTTKPTIKSEEQLIKEGWHEDTSNSRGALIHDECSLVIFKDMRAYLGQPLTHLNLNPLTSAYPANGGYFWSPDLIEGLSK